MSNAFIGNAVLLADLQGLPEINKKIKNVATWPQFVRVNAWKKQIFWKFDVFSKNFQISENFLDISLLVKDRIVVLSGSRVRWMNSAKRSITWAHQTSLDIWISWARIWYLPWLAYRLHHAVRVDLIVHRNRIDRCDDGGVDPGWIWLWNCFFELFLVRQTI